MFNTPEIKFCKTANCGHEFMLKKQNSYGEEAFGEHCLQDLLKSHQCSESNDFYENRKKTSVKQQIWPRSPFG